MYPVLMAGGQFDPRSLSPLIWLDAADTATITSSSGLVSQWNDKSGNARHVTSSGSDRPTTAATTRNGLNVITWAENLHMDFDAGSDAIVMAPLTLFVVSEMTNSPANFRRTFSARRSATGAEDYQAPNFTTTITNQASPLQIDVAANGVSLGSGFPTKTPTTLGVVTYKASSSGVSVQVDGGTPVTVGTAAAVGNMRYLRVGAGQRTSGNPPTLTAQSALIGQMAEIIAVPSNLSAGVIAQVNAHLKQKWNTP